MLSANIKVTLNCNKKCTFCYQEANDVYISVEDATIIIDKLFNENCKQIDISGGEPLLHKELEHIILLASEKGMYTRLATNGLLLNKEKISLLDKAGLREIYLSIESMEQDNINEILTNYSCCFNDKMENLRIKGVNLIINKKFLENIDDNFRLLCDSDINCIYLIPPKRSLNNEWYQREKMSLENYLTIYKYILKYKSKINIILDCALVNFINKLSARTENELNNYMCSAANNAMCIMPNGDTYPCVYSTEEKYYGGNVIHKEITSIMKSNGFQAFLDDNYKNGIYMHCIKRDIL